MKIINHVYKYKDRKNFLKHRNQLRACHIDYTEDKKIWKVEYIKDVSDYKGKGFQITSRDPELVDYFPTVYTLKFQSKLRILPA
tara:strand:- start:710 stop:961 length:252 start_codon:yes stop_codon:yes gene_type:complete